MKFTFLGGADEVGASGALIEIGGRRILVDCGIRPSPKARYGLAGDQLPDLSLIDGFGSIDLVLVTHAHTDHTGELELILERFPHVPVYATPPTVALTPGAALDEDMLEETGAEFSELTGYRLVVNIPPATAQRGAPSSPPDESAVLIPVERVLLRRFQRELVLDPAKIEKAAERARRLGRISPTIQVRRVEHGYLLLDGLYRLRAAEALGLKQVPAVVE